MPLHPAHPLDQQGADLLYPLLGNESGRAEPEPPSSENQSDADIEVLCKAPVPRVFNGQGRQRAQPRELPVSPKAHAAQPVPPFLDRLGEAGELDVLTRCYEVCVHVGDPDRRLHRSDARVVEERLDRHADVLRRLPVGVDYRDDYILVVGDAFGAQPVQYPAVPEVQRLSFSPPWVDCAGHLDNFGIRKGSDHLLGTIGGTVVDHQYLFARVVDLEKLLDGDGDYCLFVPARNHEDESGLRLALASRARASDN